MFFLSSKKKIEHVTSLAQLTNMKLQISFEKVIVQKKKGYLSSCERLELYLKIFKCAEK